MSYDTERRIIHTEKHPAARVDDVVACGDVETTIYAEVDGRFTISIVMGESDFNEPRHDIVTINKDMLAAINAAAQ